MTASSLESNVTRPTTRSQAGHFQRDSIEKENVASLLRAVRLERRDSFSKFSLALSAVVGKRISKPYIVALEQGKRPITPAIERALWRMAALLDSSDPDIINARPISVRTTYAVSENALITTDSKPCARPGCPENFIPRHPSQKYHSDFCRRQYERERNSL